MLFLQIYLFFLIYPLIAHSVPQSQTNKTQQLLVQINEIDRQIESVKNKQLTQYRFMKIAHSTIEGVNSEVKALSSSSMIDTDRNSYPILLRIGSQYYSVRGQKIFASQPNYQTIFDNYSRNQQNYIAQSINSNQFVIRKLSLNLKNPVFQILHNLHIPQSFGKVTDYQNSFSLSQQLYAFTTDQNYLLFLDQNGKIRSQIKLPIPQSSQLKIVRLNNNLLVHSAQAIVIISNNSKNETIRICGLPDGMKDFTVKYDDNNWRKFYVKDNQQIYVFQYNQKHCSVSHWFQMPSTHYDFHIANNMLILESQTDEQHFYYNLTNNGVISAFKIPQSSCDRQNIWRKMTLVPRNLGSHILCDVCAPQEQTCIQFSCYVLEDSSKDHEKALDKNDYSTFRVPIVFISLCIVIYLSLNSKKKQKSAQQQKYEKLLEREDEKMAKMMRSGVRLQKQHDS